MATEPLPKQVSEVAVDNYDVLVQAVAVTINEVLRKLVSVKVITIDNKQLIKNEKSNLLQAECLLDKFILNRIEIGEDEVFFKLLQALIETGKCRSTVSKIYSDLGQPLPSLG